MLEAVTFDFWDTLIYEEHRSMRAGHLAAWQRLLSESGHPADPVALADAFDENWAEFERCWALNAGQHTPEKSTDFVCAQIGVEPDEPLRHALIEAFRDVGETVPLETAPNAEACLGALRDAGLRLGIVCDVGLTRSPTLRMRLDVFGLLRYFDAWSFSDETGWFKPAPEAFLPALEGLGVTDPSHAAHVGDNRRTDAAGALALGMTAVRYAGIADRADERFPEATSVIADLADLPGVLGI
ncbi:MAG TPA: HAD family hydrolase [Actinomycetota bacterium]|jgi:putative hydrolase of the HAD superfamily